MWNATIINKEILKERAQIVLTVRFSDGNASHDKFMYFAATVTEEAVKRAIKEEIERLTAAASNTITTGSVDLTGVVVKPEPTQAELDKQEWFRDWGRLQNVQLLISHGVLTGTEKPVTDLRTKVATNFKAVYINDM